MPTVFISYRRSDTAGYARWLYDALAARAGESSVFMDVDTIDLGEDFVTRIQDAVRAADVAIVLIGRRWLADESGVRRIDDPEDYVHLEVAAALDAGHVRVVPVLVDGAQMPSGRELPADIALLARRNALEVGLQQGGAAINRLLESVVPAREGPAAPAAHPGGSRRPTRLTLVAGAVVVAGAAAATAILVSAGSGSGRPVAARTQSPHGGAASAAGSCPAGLAPGCQELVGAALKPPPRYPQSLPAVVEPSSASLAKGPNGAFTLAFQRPGPTSLTLIVSFGRSTYNELNQLIDQAQAKGNPLVPRSVGGQPLYCGHGDIDDVCAWHEDGFTYVADSHVGLDHSLSLDQLQGMLSSAQPVTR